MFFMEIALYNHGVFLPPPEKAPDIRHQLRLVLCAPFTKSIGLYVLIQHLIWIKLGTVPCRSLKLTRFCSDKLTLPLSAGAAAFFLSR